MRDPIYPVLAVICILLAVMLLAYVFKDVRRSGADSSQSEASPPVEVHVHNNIGVASPTSPGKTVQVEDVIDVGHQEELQQSQRRSLDL